MTEATLNRLEETLAADPANRYALNELRAAPSVGEPVRPSTNKQIKKLVKAMRRQRAWIAAREAKMDVMRDQLQALLTESGENWADDDGYARLVPASTRTSYDAQQLDNLILRDPGFDCLRAYRKESKIRGSVQVK